MHAQEVYGLKLSGPVYRTNLKHRFPHVRRAVIWNGVPVEIVESVSLKNFKINWIAMCRKCFTVHRHHKI